MRVVTGREMLAIDRHSIAEGMPAAALMELAGRSVAELVISICGSVAGKRIHLLCGTGNNGGDGFVAARHLINAGARVRVFLSGSAERLQGDAAAFHRVYLQTGGQVTQVDRVTERLSLSLGLADLFVDALLGTGAQGPPREPMASLIRVVNELRRPVVAIDVPSGVESDTGWVPGVAINATHTVTFGLPKLGALLYPGAAHTGELHVADIGFPAAHLQWREAGWPERIWLRPDVVAAWGRPRQRNSHKGTYGKVLVVAGGQGMIGAGALSSMAALRTGAGLLTWAGPESLWPVMAQKVTEATTLGLMETAPGAVGPSAVSAVTERLQDGSVLALGPGLGRHTATGEFVRLLLESSASPTVIDADGLYALASSGQSFIGKPHSGWVLTPHPGEAARLLRCDTAEVEADRVSAINRLAQMWQCVVVLKGVPTLVAGPADPLYINSSGNPGMATGGSGDVLTGVIAGLLAQGWSPLEAAAAGVFIHGCAGDIAAQQGEAGLIAGDIVAALPLTLAKLWENAGRPCFDATQFRSSR